MEAFLTGVVGKLQDDLYDNQLASGWIMESLKGLHWTLAAFVLIHDFNFGFLAYSMGLLSISIDPDAWGSYETSFLVVFPIFLILGIRTAHIPSLLDFFCIISLLSSVFFEQLFTPEEFSITKWFLRSGGFVYAVCLTYLGLQLGVSSTSFHVLMWCSGYSLVSSLFQVGLLTSSGTFSLPSFGLP